MNPTPTNWALFTYKNEDVGIFDKLSTQMQDNAYVISADQIHCKIRKLQASYRQVTAGVHISYY